MKKMRKYISRILAILLVVSMLVGELPAAFVYASANVEATAVPVVEEQGDISREKALETESPAEEMVMEEATIVQEIRERRDENTKYFEMSDGTVKACIYPQAVHYLKDGVYEEIDNTLELVEPDLSITETVSAHTTGEVQATEDMEEVEATGISESVAKTITDTVNAAIPSETTSETEEEIDEPVEAADETEEAVDETKVSYYENKANAFKVKFPTTYGEGYTEFSDENGYVRFQLLGTEKKKIKNENPKNNRSKDKTTIKNVNGRVVYKALHKDIDVQYDLVGDTLKETIVLNKKTKQDFVFSVETSANTAVLNEDGSIRFYSMDGRELYVIAAPFMQDAIGEYSDAVEVELTTTTGGYTLTYRPNEEWLYEKDRQYPVRIDPTMFKAVTVDKENVTDTYVGTMQTASNPDPRGGDGWDVINIGRRTTTIDGAQIRMRGMIQFDLPSELGQNDCIIDAKLYLTHYPLDSYVSVDDIQIDLHELTGDFNEDSTWWSTQPAYDSRVIDYALVDTKQYFPDTEVSYDVYNFTELANKWHNDSSTNHGLLLKLHEEDTTVTSSKQVYYLSSNSVYFSDVSKFVEITYRNTLGMEDYWSYSAYDVGSGGSSYVNLYNGNHVFVHEDISNCTELNAFTLAHIYNTGLASDNSSRCGNGWRLNLLQWMKKATVPGNSKVKYVYTDGDGTQHYLVETDGKIVDEDGLGYTFSQTGVADLPWKLTTKDKTVMTFDGLGFLRYIDDINGNRITFIFDTIVSGVNYLTGISTSSGDAITLGYDSSKTHLLTATDKAGRVTSYSYTGDKLTTITYPDGTTTKFTYDSLGRILTVREAGTSGYNYTYTDSGRVATVKEIGKSNVVGNTDTYTYNNGQTSVKDSTQYTTTYQFDTSGRATCIFDSEGNICSQKFTDDKTSTSEIFKNNKVEVEASGSKYVNNLLKNGSLTSGLSYWTSSGGTASAVTTKALLTPKSIKIVNSNEGASVIQQTVSGLSSGTYTLSGYVQGENISGEGGVGVQIVTNTRTITSELVKDPEDTVTDNGFSRVSATVTLASGESINRVQAGLMNAAGTAYIDSLQLEEGAAVGPCNLIENSGFEIAGTGVMPYAFTPSDNIGASGRSSNAKKEGSYGLVLTSNALQKRNFSQSVAVSGKALDAYTFGAWVRAHSAEVHDGNKPVAMTLKFINTDGTSTEKTIDYNTAVNEWQFASQIAVAEKDYSSMQISIRYENNVNNAYFDCLFLYRDTVMSYTYDGDGNVVSTKDYASQQSEFQYSGNNLSKILEPTGTGFEYYYDGKNRLIGAKSSEGTQQIVSNNAQGQPIRVRTTSGANAASIQANETYYIRLKGSGKYLTVEGASTANGANVVQAEFTGENNQKWKIEQTVDGYFVFHPVHASGKSLDIPSGGDTEDLGIITYSTNYGVGQKFQVNPQADYTYTVIPKCSSTKKKVSVNTPTTQNEVTLRSSTDGEGTSWYFENVKDTPAKSVTSGTVYRIRAYHSGRYLDVTNNGTATGTAVNQWQLNQGKNQQFLFTKYGDTQYYTIKPMHYSGNLLSVSDAPLDTGFYYLSVGDTTITDKKLFRLEYDSTKRGFLIIPKSDESRALDVVQAGLTNGDQVILYPKTTTNNRYFLLEECAEEIESSIAYTSDGNYVASTTDERGYTTTYNYDGNKDLLSSTTNAKGTATAYTYNANNDRLQKVSSGSSEVNYTYNTDGSLKAITSPSDTNYSFTYDNYGRSISTKVGSRTLGGYTYKNNYSSLVSQFAYGNGDIKSYTYDNNHRVVQEKQNDEVAKTYVYDKFGNVSKETDGLKGVTTSYRYDLSGRLSGLTNTEGQKLNYVYDKYNRITHQHYNSGGNAVTTEYEYGKNTVSNQKTGLLYGVSYDGVERLYYRYDDLNRKSSRMISGDDINAGTVYKYVDGAGTNKTSTLVSLMRFAYATSHELPVAYYDDYTYTYDKLGNIETISLDGEQQVRYSYNAKNELQGVITSDTVRGYIYDDGGNILRVNETKNGTTTQIKSYTYGDGEWKDLLTSYNGETLTYDEIGNPIDYRDGMNLTWKNGRQLFIVDDIISDTCYTYYDYDADGYRSEKQVMSDPRIYYTYIDGVLMGEKSSEREMIYLYDEQGLISGVRVIEGNDVSDYYYLLNIQGDVVGIVDEAGVLVASYTYDEWGKVLTIEGSDADGIGALNPIRYRGYYYDTETGFYYLGSRYYDPEIGRFLNADDESVLAATPEAITDKNLYAYCDNNPIMRMDTSGAFWETVFDVVSLCASVAEVAINPTDPWAWAGLVGDAVDLIPFVTGVGEVTKAAKITLEAVEKSDDVVKAARKLYNASDGASAFRKSTGSYEILYESGRNYVGKGGFYRATSSAKRYVKKEKDRVVSIMWKPAKTSKQAFIDEYIMQKRFGGVLSSNRDLLTYNKIWSPGRRYFGD